MPRPPLAFHKALPLLVLPVGFCLLCLAAMLRWPRRRLALLPLCVLGLFSWPPFADFASRNRYPGLPVEQCPVSDAIFPLGGILTESSALSGIDEFTDAADRFERALALYQAGRARVLVFSNVRPPAPGNAMRLFRNAPAENVPVPVGYQTRDFQLRGREFSPDRWTPQAEALFHSERALREYMGSAFYALTR